MLTRHFFTQATRVLLPMGMLIGLAWLLLFQAHFAVAFLQECWEIALDFLRLMRKICQSVLLGWAILVAVPLILLLEWRFPAKPRQKTFSLGFAQDVVWLFLEAIILVTIVGAYVQFLRSIYDEHLGFLHIAALAKVPAAVQFVLVVLVADFFGWFHHWVRHKVPWFWHFHTVHHSQKEMNIFTDMRYHAMEYVIAKSIEAIPLFMVGQGYSFVWLTFHLWYTRLYHANIKSNFGPLRYVMVTPQSHRVHHSIEPRHHDCNYGVLFCIWDRMFGTQYPHDDEYPETGIEDHHFPYENKSGLWNLISTPFAQHWYPIRQIAHSLKREKPASS